MHDLNSFQRDVLYAVAGLEHSDNTMHDEPHGLGIKAELEEYYECEIHHGRLYPNLDDLVNKGLIQKEKADRRTNAYSITERGRRELQDRIEWQAERVGADAAPDAAPADD